MKSDLDEFVVDKDNSGRVNVAVAYYNVSACIACLLFLFLVYCLAVYREGTVIYVVSFVFFVACLISFLILYYSMSSGAGWKGMASLVFWLAISLSFGGSLARSHYSPYWKGFEPDPLTGWKGVPNLKNFVMKGGAVSFTVTTNALGYRETEGVRDVEYLVQGDSNVFGYGLADDELLTAQLNKKSGKIAFYNAGVYGFDVNNYYFQYNKIKDEVSFRNRIIMFNVGNDFTVSILKTPYYMMRPYLDIDPTGKPVEKYTHPPVSGQIYGVKFIDKYASYDSIVSAPLRYSWWDYYPDFFPRAPLAMLLIEKFMAFPCFKTIQFTPSKLEFFYPTWMLLKKDHWPEPFKSYAKDFKRILKALHEQDQSVILCLYPMRQQVLKEDRRKAVASLLKQGWKHEDICPLALNKYLMETCREIGMDAVDTTPALQGMNDDIFQANNSHLSSKGMEIVATVLWEHLEKAKSDAKHDERP